MNKVKTVVEKLPLDGRQKEILYNSLPKSILEYDIQVIKDPEEFMGYLVLSDEVCTSDDIGFSEIFTEARSSSHGTRILGDARLVSDKGVEDIPQYLDVEYVPENEYVSLFDANQPQILILSTYFLIDGVKMDEVSELIIYLPKK